MTTPPRRREVWLVDFEPAIGAEIRKTRPAIVINEDEVGRLPLRIVVPLTDWKPAFAPHSWFVLVPATTDNGLRKASAADTFQIKSISLDRFRRKLGVISEDQADEIAEAIANGVGAP
jgi:mRNA interferase MazF